MSSSKPLADSNRWKEVFANQGFIMPPRAVDAAPTGWKPGMVEGVSKGAHKGSVVLWIRAPEWVAKRLDSVRPSGLEQVPAIPHISVVYYPARDSPDTPNAWFSGIAARQMAEDLYHAFVHSGPLEVTVSGTA